MPNVTVRNLPDRVYELLQKRAVENHRSVNQEIIFCLERIAARKESPGHDEFIRDLQKFHSKFNGLRLTDKEINAAKRRGRP